MSGAASMAGHARGRWRPSRNICIGAASVGTVLLLWQTMYSLGVVPTVLLPGPVTLARQAVVLAGQGGAVPFQLEHDITLTMVRLLGGFACAVALAVPLGVISALWPPAGKLLQPVFAVLMAVPAIAIVPILMLITGIGNATDVTVVIFTAFVPIAVYVHEGVKLVDRRYYWTARSFGTRPVDVFRHILLPGIAVPLIAGLRMGMGYAWRSLIATESLTALSGGLGYSIFQAAQFFDTRTIYLYMVVIALLGFGIEALFRRAERRTAIRWGVIASGGSQ
ncbi:ABC transporter permease [Acidiphilium multivorum]|uniref:ABC transporter permease n=1 Tax=Acidiphilium multivorum TaxID=62140 RepID=UPI001F4BF07C|nr:ABC transporter permease [Acidiphilium multivorum]UNC14832.1 ABC transporter permease [Acidiphilium multivorum]